MYVHTGRLCFFCCMQKEHIVLLFHTLSALVFLPVHIPSSYTFLIFLIALFYLFLYNIKGRVWSVSRKNLMAADVARRGLTRFGEVPLITFSHLFFSQILHLFFSFSFRFLPSITIALTCFILSYCPTFLPSFDPSLPSLPISFSCSLSHSLPSLPFPTLSSITLTQKVGQNLNNIARSIGDIGDRWAYELGFGAR